MKKAIVLLSGGIDSAVTLYAARATGFQCVALSFDYLQSHASELKYAAIQASLAAHEHIVMKIDASWMRTTALVNNGLTNNSNLPSSYVPARNVIFLSLALALAGDRQIFDIFIGASADDYTGYPDCRPEFIASFQEASRAGMGNDRYKIHAPLLFERKDAIVKKALSMGVDLSKTSSCYHPIGSAPCMSCGACLVRSKGFEGAGVHDPVSTLTPAGR